MNSYFCKALELVSVGVIIIESGYNIIFWNKAIEKLSEIPKECALGKYLPSVCPIFSKPIYADILDGALLKGQNRFCSSKLHKAFIYPLKNNNNKNIRQNMIVEPIYIDGVSYAMIQIIDITDQVTNEYRLTNLIIELEKSYKKAKESEEYNKSLAEKDALTGLYNRYGLTRKLEEEILNVPYEAKKAALFFLDIDNFKYINDTHGHLLGDLLLNQVSERLKSCVRNTDIISRLGGDEFIIVLLGVGSREKCSSIADKIVNYMNEPFYIDKKTINITISIGIANVDNDISVDDLIRKADSAMYEAKRAGRNGYKFYTDEYNLN